MHRAVSGLSHTYRPTQDWIPNYGVWLDEVEPFGMTHLMKKKWPRASVFLGGGDGEKKLLPRPYGQVGPNSKPHTSKTPNPKLDTTMAKRTPSSKPQVLNPEP